MRPLERELAVLRGLASCRSDDERIDEAEAELAMLRKIEETAAVAGATMGDLLRAGKDAAEVLRTEADALRQCSTVNGTWDGTELEAQAEYERYMALADRLTPPMLPLSDGDKAPAERSEGGRA